MRDLCSKTRYQSHTLYTGRQTLNHWTVREAPPCVWQSLSLTLCDPGDCSPSPRLLCPWGSPGKNTGVGCHSLLQGGLPDPGIEAGSLALKADSSPSEPENYSNHDFCPLQFVFLHYPHHMPWVPPNPILLLLNLCLHLCQLFKLSVQNVLKKSVYIKRNHFEEMRIQGWWLLDTYLTPFPLEFSLRSRHPLCSKAIYPD